MWTCRCENRRVEDCESTVRIAALKEALAQMVSVFQTKADSYPTHGAIAAAVKVLDEK